MRKTSDRICKVFGLSVIEDPKRGKSKHYRECKADQKGRPTWRGIIKNDVDEVIRQSMTDKQFFYLLRQKGYTMKQGKDITVHPQGKQRGIKLARNLGDDYTYEAICKSILTNGWRPQRIPQPHQKTMLLRLHGSFSHQRRFTGLRALYIRYCFKPGILPKEKPISEARLHFLFKEDFVKFDSINKETRLLCVHKIDTSQQRFLYQSKQKERMATLVDNRKHL